MQRLAPLVLASFTLLPTSLAAEGTVAGELDAAFGASGFASSALSGVGDFGNDLAVQPDGRIVCVGTTTHAGGFVVVRFEADGSLDAGFGQGGVVTIDLPGVNTQGLRGIALQPDGRLVLCGQGFVSPHRRLVTLRLLEGGDLDPSFGQGGIQIEMSLAFDAVAEDVALQDDGRIVVVGWSVEGNQNTLVARLLADGALDPGFGTSGVTTADFGNGRDDASFAVLVQPGGRLVVAGGSSVSGGAHFHPYDYLLAGFGPDGQLDTSFGSAGRRLLNAGPWFDQLTDLAQLPDGRLVASGSSGLSGDRFAFGAARTSADGAPDPSFGTGGLRRYPETAGSSAFAESVAVDPEGRMLLAGRVRTPDVMALLRVLPSGELDPSFGSGGRVRLDVPARDPDEARGLALSADGILVGGSAGNTFGSDIVVARVFAETRARETYCLAAANSVGAGANMSSSGTASVAANDLVLEASGGIPQGTGLFFYGSTRVQLPFGEGLRCVGGSTFRLLPPVQADAAGHFARPLDLNAQPADAGAGRIEAGSNWNFQLWYRDAAAGGSGFNASDGLAVPFCS